MKKNTSRNIVKFLYRDVIYDGDITLIEELE